MKSAAETKERDSMQDVQTGVGGRREETPSPGQGGGYRDICSSAGAPLGGATDPRLAELRDVGLSRAWLTVAEAIGVDAFIEVWKVLDQYAALVNPGQRELYIPIFNSYLRFQRNRFILALAEQGSEIEDIKKQVRTALREDISARHVARIIAKLKAAP